MSRLSFRPCPLDIHKKLPIVKSIKDFEDDDAPVAAASTRNTQLLRLAADTDNEQALHSLSVRFTVFQSVYDYWTAKREQWRKPILQCLQPPPPVNDTNPYNVFRPREKVHRLHTRRMQRRENNVPSFEKLSQVRHNLDQVKTILEALIKREEKKREVMECEVNLQRVQSKYKFEAQLVEEKPALPGFTPAPCNFGSSEDDFMDLDDTTNGHAHARPIVVHSRSADSKLVTVPAGCMM